jgi:hypothetical protein
VRKAGIAAGVEYVPDTSGRTFELMCDSIQLEEVLHDYDFELGRGDA